MKEFKTITTGLLLSGFMVSASAQAQQGSAIICDITERTYVKPTGMPSSTQTKVYTQTYRFDDTRSNVSMDMSLDQSTGQYAAIPKVSTDIRASSAEMLYFCTDERHRYEEFQNTTRNGTATFKYGPVTLNLSNLTVSYEHQAIARGNNGSGLVMNTQASGSCRKG